MNTRPRISIIAALGTETNAIGKDNKLLWHIPKDLERFKKLTTGHPIIMGRKTFESIGRVLPDRTNIIITRNKHFQADNCVVTHSLKDALEEAREREKKEIFIIGGGEIYTQALPCVDRLYLTLVLDQREGDAFFPNYSEFTKKLSEERGTHNNTTYTWITLGKERSSCSG